MTRPRERCDAKSACIDGSRARETHSWVKYPATKASPASMPTSAPLETSSAALSPKATGAFDVIIWAKCGASPRPSHASRPIAQPPNHGSSGSAAPKRAYSRSSPSARTNSTGSVLTCAARRSTAVRCVKREGIDKC